MKSSITYLFGTGNNLRRNMMVCRVMITILFFMLSTAPGYAQPGKSVMPVAIRYDLGDTTDYSDPEDAYDEVSITLNVPRIGSLEIPAIIFGRTVCLSVKDLFDFLKIRNIPAENFDSIAGFFISPAAPYLIDKTNNTINYKGKISTLKPEELVRTAGALYLNVDYFGKVFGLDCVFDFRSLTVTLETKIDLPVIREMQLELMRRNLNQLKGEKKADTVIGGSLPLFHVGMMDWSVTSAQETNRRADTRANLDFGGVLAGGEFNLSLNYNSSEKATLRQQYYKWRYVDNDHAALRQVIAGKMFAQSTSSIYAAVTGLQLTNTPTTYRRSFGTYTLSNNTEPGWMVELYINNVLVNYTKADASGFYSFEVPMVYGNSLVKLRFYGPWGEERSSEKYVSIPFNFIPFHQLEYNVTAGVVNDDHKGLYSRATLNYGLGERITVGGGMEYLSTVSSGKFMPFLNVSLSLGQHILVSGEHIYGVRSKGIVSYRTPANLQVDLSYAKYDKDQTAVQSSYLDEKRVVVSIPFRARKFTAFSRLTLNQFTLPNNKTLVRATKYTSAEFMFSAVVAGVSANLTTYAVISDPGNPLVYSNLGLTFRLPGGIRFMPQAQYEYRRKNFSMIKAGLEKSIFNRGFLNIAYEKNFISSYVLANSNAFTVGLRYNFSFAQTFFSATSSRHSISTTQTARGSLLYDNKTNYLDLSNQTAVGKGGIVILPFLDLNYNGQRDQGEPRAFGLNLRINGGYIERNDRDTTIRITGLEAFGTYFIELDKTNFDNVAWQIKKQTMSVTIEPNNFKLIEVPVTVAGEVSGTVYVNDAGGKTGLGRVIVNIYNADLEPVGRTITETDGYFSFMGLAPGTYTASIDPAQLKKLQMTASPILLFKIHSSKEGDVADGLQFTLQSLGIK